MSTELYVVCEHLMIDTITTDKIAAGKYVNPIADWVRIQVSSFVRRPRHNKTLLALVLQIMICYTNPVLRIPVDSYKMNSFGASLRRLYTVVYSIQAIFLGALITNSR